MALSRKLSAAAMAVAVLAGLIGGALVATPAHAAPAILCQLRVDNPHRSSHVAGTVNVIARVSCTSAVRGIDLVVGLVRDGVTQTNVNGSNAGVAALQLNTATLCITGNYQARSAARVYFPPGGVPSSQTMVVSSPTLLIIC